MKRNFLRPAPGKPPPAPTPGNTAWRTFSRTRPQHTRLALCVNVCAIRGLKFGVIGKLLSGKEVQSSRPREKLAGKALLTPLIPTQPPPFPHPLPNLSPTFSSSSIGGDNHRSNQFQTLPPWTDELGLKDGKRLQREEVGLGFHLQALIPRLGQSRKILPSPAWKIRLFVPQVVAQSGRGRRILRICGFSNGGWGGNNRRRIFSSSVFTVQGNGWREYFGRNSGFLRSSGRALSRSRRRKPERENHREIVT